MVVPVFLDTATGSAQLLAQWARMYHYGHQIMPTIAVCTLLLYSHTSLERRRSQRPWRLLVLAGIVTVSIAPFTWIFMEPTNNELFRLGAATQAQPTELEGSEAIELVLRWTFLHFARSLLPLIGTIMGVIGTFQSSATSEQ